MTKLKEAVESLFLIFALGTFMIIGWHLVNHYQERHGQHQMNVCLYEQASHQTSDYCRDFLAEKSIQ